MDSERVHSMADEVAALIEAHFPHLVGLDADALRGEDAA